MQGWLQHHPLLIVALIPLWIAIFWVFPGHMIAGISGWKKLSSRFRLQQQTYLGPRWKWQSAMMRMFASYNGCLIVGADQMGLFLDIMILLRPGHPALLVPWNEVRVVTELWTPKDVVELRFGQNEQVPFKIRGSLASELRTAAGASWPA